MQLPMLNFPILTPEQANPYNQAVATGLQRMKQGIDLEYAPLEKYAQAASRLTYHNLMGPQFLAAAMKNDKFLASLTPEQQNALAPYLVNAVNSASMPQMKPNQGLLSGLASWVQNLISPQQGGAKQQAPAQTSLPSPQATSLPQTPQVANQPAAEAPQQDNTQGITPDQQQMISAYMNSPEAQQAAQKEGYFKIPAMEQLVDWYKNKHAQVAPQQKPLAERTGEFTGIVKEGEEAGKIRAQDIKDLGGVIEQGQNANTTLQAMAKIVTNPELEAIRKLPLAQQHEFAWYAKHGNKDQQRLVGDFYDLSGEVLTNAAQRFKGAFRVGEQHLLNTMKPNDSDTVYTMQGKVRSMMYLNDMMTKRAQLTNQIMEKEHISKADALTKADKQLNGDQVRRQVEETMNPRITIKNAKTGETRTVSLAEARKMGVSDV